MVGMDNLQYRIAAEQGLSDMRSDGREGSSVAGNRMGSRAPVSSTQEYLQAVAQGRAPPTGIWGNPSDAGLRAPSAEERAQITPTVDLWSEPPPKVPTHIYNRPDPNERSVVQELAEKGAGL